MYKLPKIINSSFFLNSFDSKVSILTNLFIDSPYLSNPIEDSLENIFRFDGFDCVTFVETVIALAIGNSS